MDDSDTPSTGNAPQPQDDDYVQTFTAVLSLLQKVDGQTRERILKSAATFFGVRLAEPANVVSHTAPSNRPEASGTYFSEDRSISAKQFMFEKQPRTDVEKVACLAFYLTHYRDTPHFKTLDISKLNTEAAQAKFSNPAVAVENASKTNYLVPATKGNKQLSALGEQFVQALPNREKAREIMVNARPRRKARRASGDSKNDIP